MNQEIKPLTLEQLASPCNSQQFTFTTSDELPDFPGMIGQERAIDAMAFGVGMQHPGYNLYLMGPAGVGKHTLLKSFLDKAAAQRPAADDWCYVFNFDNPQKPNAIRLPAGRGRHFRDDMRQMVEDLRTAIPSAFETEQYHARLQEIHEELREKAQTAFNGLADEAKKHNIVIIRAGDEYSFSPVKDNRAMTPEEYENLPKEEQQRIEEIVQVLEERLRNILHQRSQWQKEARERIKALNREVGMYAAAHLVQAVKDEYQDVDEVAEYLDAILEDVIDNLHEFRATEQPQRLVELFSEQPSVQRYQVNLLVDNSEASGAPIIYEDNPMFQSLVGRVEYLAQMGTLVTDFQLIKPGCLHKANGGFLVLDALKVLLQPYAWEALKRILFSKEINIQSLAEMFGLVNTVSLEPEPIPLDIKVILVGDRYLYYLLLAHDKEFEELFKVDVDFSESMDCNPETFQVYAQVLATQIRKNKLLPFERNAIVRVIEQGMREVEDSTRISTHMSSVTDLLREADFWAKQASQTTVRAEDVQTAIDKQIYRADRARERLYDEIAKGTIMISVSGTTVAQVNGLFVIELGNFLFSQPARITATVRLGDGEIIDIEREVELGGAIHSKGVMILSAYLGAHYAKIKPLSMSATLVFEQSYGQVEGDSATVGELCTLLSAIGRLPVKQSLAVTGSANQHGQVQAIGGVNEKIEGFFDICRAQGLTGEQGVIIPRTNVAHLMLREDVKQAVADKRFFIYPVETVDQAISLLTGLPAGERDAEGYFPPGTVNYAVEEQLLLMAELKHEAEKKDEHHEEQHDEEQTSD